jgi:hypothetical protein
LPGRDFVVDPGRAHEFRSDGGLCGMGVALGVLCDDPFGGRDVRRGRCVWIGQRVWPGPATLDRAGLLDRSLLVDAPSPALRAWSAELCVKCAAVGAVVVDANGLDLTATRRLQLAVRDRDCRLILLRRAGEAVTSAAECQWAVSPVPVGPAETTADPPRRPRWSVTLIKRKGGHQTTHAVRTAGGATPRPAGLPTAGEIFRHDHAFTLLDTDPRGTARIFEWDAQSARASPLDCPCDVAEESLALPTHLADGSSTAAVAWAG